MRRLSLVALLTAPLLLAGCDLLGIESPAKLAQAREADGRAIGAACRHAGRGIEDCFELNRRTDRAAMFAGWREMNDYMRENEMAPVAPQFTPRAGASDSRPAPDAVAQRKAEPAPDSRPGKDAKPRDS